MADRRQALRSLPEIRRFLLRDVRPTGRTLGVGSYGSVDEVVVSGLLCAGKKIHEMLINHAVQIIAQKYVAECQLMSELRHPNIVQFLGLCFLEDSTLPVLVMEKLVTSLDEILENTPNIPLGVKKSILMDVARGLIYLHSREPRPIIHRDLSAKNVLLNSSLNAKISDLGNSRIVDFQPGQLVRTMSVAPGTTVYMPPEALEETARYGPSLDIFSFGHLSLFTLNQDFPGDLLRHNYPDPNNRRRLIARSEVERRQTYFTRLYQQLGERHPLVQLTERCLDDDSEYRPSAVDVLQQLEAVEIEDPYQHLTKLDMIRLLQQRTDPQREEEIQRLQAQLQQMQLDVAESRTQRDRAEGERERTIQEKDEIIRQKDEIIRGNVAEIQRLQEEVQQKDDLLRQRVPTPRGGGGGGGGGGRGGRAAAEAVAVTKSHTPLHKKTQLHFKQLKDLPTSMYSAQAVIYRGTLYVGGGVTSGDEFVLCAYNFKPDTWDTIETPTEYYALAVYQDQLVLAGGHFPDRGYTPTDQLWLTNNQQHKFKQTIPHMITATYSATAIATQTHLIIAGGYSGSKHLDIVQVYDGRQWTRAQPLPVPASCIKHTIHNNNLYLMGGINQGRQVFYTSLPSFLQTLQQTGKPNTTTVWDTLTDAPLPHSSIAVLQSQLVAIGGGGYYSSPSPSLHFYSDSSHRWERMDATLPEPLIYTCSITLPTGEFLIIGGRGTKERSSHVYKVTLI